VAQARTSVRLLVLCVLGLGWTGAAHAQQAPSVAWQPQWKKVDAVEYVATGVFALSAVGLSLFVDQRSSGGEGGVLFDGSLRALVRARSRAGRDRARIVGDLGYRTMLAYPLVDLGVTWAVHGDSEVALQMLSIDLEVISFAGLVGMVTNHAVGRARPSHGECRRDPGYERFCNTSDQFASFLSGHTIMATVGAAVTCAHHLNLPLYGGGAGDIAACAAASGLALTTGIARMVNDRHWATDVTAALAIGTAAGYLWPVWYHYRRGPESEVAAHDRWLLALPTLTADGASLAVMGGL